MENGPLDGYLVDHEIVKVGFSLKEPELRRVCGQCSQRDHCGFLWLMLDL